MTPSESARARAAALRNLAPFLVVLAAYGVVAWICARLPLFNLLGYESSFVFAVVASFASLHLTVVLVHRWRRLPRDPLDGPSTSLGLVAWIYWRATLASWLMLVLPLDILLANAAFVRNCNPLEGAAWFVLLPGLSASVAAAVGVLLGLLPVRRRYAVLAGYLVVLASIGLGVLRFYSHPPVSQYDPFAGFFSGSLYDDHISITGTFLAARLYHLSWAALALLIAARFLLLGERRLVWRPREPRRRLAVGLAASALVLAALWWAGGRLAYRVGAQDIARELGGELRTPHFVIHYPLGSEVARDIHWHAVEAEHRHSQLRRFFGVSPRDRIRVFLFADSDQKRRWYGADRVDMAKPWRLEVYLTLREFPHPVLKHELAHVFAAVFGDRVFGVSFRWKLALGFFPVPAWNPGLVEGAAVAADWAPRGGLTPHEWAAAMVRLGKAPPLGAVMGYGFFGSASSQAYTAAGSFSRYLVDRHGPGSFRALYRSGGDFRAAYGRGLDELEAGWRRFLGSVPLGERELALARERFRQRPVFSRPCAHEVARLEREAARSLALGEARVAAGTFRRLCRIDPGDPDHLFGLVVAWMRAGREEAALSAARELWQHPAATPPLRAQLLSYVGTDAWRRGELDRARRLYSEAEAMPIPVGMGRDLTVRRLALGDARLGSLLRPLLVPREEDHSPEESWERLERELPEHGLVRYLVGSYRLSQGDWVRAAANLEAALALELPDERFWREALLRLGRARFRAGAFGAARETFSRLDVPAESEAVRLEARDWMERCDFFARYGAALGLRVQVGAAQPAQGQGEGP